MRAGIPSATRAGLPARLRLQYRARHRRATKRLRQTTGTHEGHRAAMARIMAAWKRERGESRIGSSVTTEVAFTMSPSSRLLQPFQPQVRTRHPELPVADWQALDVLHNPCRK